MDSVVIRPRRVGEDPSNVVEVSAERAAKALAFRQPASKEVLGETRTVIASAMQLPRVRASLRLGASEDIQNAGGKTGRFPVEDRIVLTRMTV